MVVGMSLSIFEGPSPNARRPSFVNSNSKIKRL